MASPVAFQVLELLKHSGAAGELADKGFRTVGGSLHRAFHCLLIGKDCIGAVIADNRKAVRRRGETG